MTGGKMGLSDILIDFASDSVDDDYEVDDADICDDCLDTRSEHVDGEDKCVCGCRRFVSRR